MGYAVYHDARRKRDLGYGVPAVCDHPECNEEIDRGLSHVCGGEPYSNEFGCALYFCARHLHMFVFADSPVGSDAHQVCERCAAGQPEFPMKPDVMLWVAFKLADESWEEWRRQNPEEVAVMRTRYEAWQRENPEAATALQAQLAEELA